MLLTLIGAALGLAGAVVLTRWMSSMLFGITASDPATYATVLLVSLGAALLACAIPARRATRVDPLVALRYE
jgi:putative ABC transport system permease protein